MYKTIKSDHIEQGNDLKVYCFPDISGQSLKKSEEISANNSEFHRFDIQPSSKAFKYMVEHVGIGEKRSEKSKEESGKREGKAYEKGFVEGEKAGIEAVTKKVEPALNNFNQAATELENIAKKIHLNAERESIDLALAIAKKIVGHEIATNKEVVLSVVKEALKDVVDPEKIRIRMSPSDMEVLRDAKFQFSKYVDNIEAIIFEEDETIGCGGCVIETNLGNIDARIEKQLQAVEQALRLEFQQSETRE